MLPIIKFSSLITNGKQISILNVKRVFQQHLRFMSETTTHSSEEYSNYESVVGLEVHAQITKSNSKLFSRSPVVFGYPTNTKVSFFDAALPGTLPVVNKSCVEAGVITALAFNCTVHETSRFDRKHYFYPDLPAGYQITQQLYPLASNGVIKFVVHDAEKGAYECCAYLKQLQLEQDSGKSFHVREEKSLVDLNRAGVGLMELVFEPTLKNGTEAAALVKEIIMILQRCDTCSCKLEEGTLRVDANISINKVGDPLGERTEVKNVNSLRYIARAIDYEIQRQVQILQNGGFIGSETRAYDYSTKTTVFIRDKERLQDYRFMPEPNLPPLQIFDKSEGINFENVCNITDVETLRRNLPILPEAERSCLVNDEKIPLQIADKLVKSEGLKEAFDQIKPHTENKLLLCNFLLSNVQAQLNSRNLSFKNSPLCALNVAGIVELIASNSISEATANDILEMHLNGETRSAKEIVNIYNWYLVSDETELAKLCREVMANYPKIVKKYRKSGKRWHMSTLLNALNKKVNNRVSIKDAENVFNKLIHKQDDSNKNI